MSYFFCSKTSTPTRVLRLLGSFMTNSNSLTHLRVCHLRVWVTILSVTLMRSKTTMTTGPIWFKKRISEKENKTHSKVLQYVILFKIPFACQSHKTCASTFTWPPSRKFWAIVAAFSGVITSWAKTMGPTRLKMGFLKIHQFHILFPNKSYAEKFQVAPLEATTPAEFAHTISSACRANQLLWVLPW